MARSSTSPFSKAMPRSPLPPTLRHALDVGVDSPLSSASPSPVRNTSTTPKKKARRRRESGLVPPVPTANDGSSPLPAPKGTSSDANEIFRPAEQGVPEAALHDDEPRHSLEQSISSSSTASSAPTGLSDMPFIDEDGKRGRRSRMSVNYKEPSLAK
jgi:hypothetical protein